MKKKILALCLVVALMATAIAGATLAYFSDTTNVVNNTFTVGDVDIKLDEEDITKDDDSRTEEGNKYENIYPGQTVTKDPTVTFVKDSRDCYVRMIVTVEGYENLVTAFPDQKYWVGTPGQGVFLLEMLVNDTWDKEVWIAQNEGEALEAMKTGKYEFRYHEIVKDDAAKAGKSLEPLFEEILFPADLTNKQIAALNNVSIKVVAHAMQAEGFESDEAGAWAAFDAE